MANVFLTIDMITNECLRVLENNLTFAKYVNRQYDDQFAKTGYKIGDTLRVRKPPRYVGRSGPTLQVEDSIDTSVALTVGANATNWFQNGEQFGVDITFTSADRALKMDEFSDRYVKPAMATVANRIDSKGLSLAKAVANTVGTPGTTPATDLVWLNAGVKLDNNAAARDDMRYICMNPQAQASTVSGLKGLFQQATLIGEQYATGTMGRGLGFLFNMDQNVYRHTVGALGGTPLVNLAQGNATLTTDPFTTSFNLVTDGWTAAAAARLKQGDVITIGVLGTSTQVLGVNPQSRDSTGELQQFVVTADVSSDVSGNATVPIAPNPVYGGPFQTITAQIPNNAEITIVGTAATQYPQNLAFHKDAFILAMADLPVPNGVDMASRKTYKNMSMRLVSQYDIVNDRFPCRIDVLYGWCAAQPQIACRVWG